MAEAPVAAIPSNLKNLRACLRCKLVKSYQQFQDDGCDNCNQLEAYDTTPTFHGLIAMMDPASSWVAKWQYSANLARGLYAVTVTDAPKDS